MKVLVTGVAGQLGHDVMNELAKRGIEGIGSDLHPEFGGVQDGTSVCTMPYVSMDITNMDQVEGILQTAKPDVVVHCAAWTAVDDAEDQQEIVHRVNVIGTENIARCCKTLDAKMLYISTDYVFNGEGNKPWEPDCREYEPLNIYGKSKLGGEQAVVQNLEKFFIVRIAWVFGVNGGNFIKTMLRLGENHELLTVVNDQIGTPTYTYDLAKLLVDMIGTDKYGYYHATNEGEYISWYDFAVEIFRQAAELGKDCYNSEHLTVKPVTTKEYGVSKARRPFNSRLDRSKLTEQGFELLPNWKDALTRYLNILFS